MAPRGSFTSLLPQLRRHLAGNDDGNDDAPETEVSRGERRSVRWDVAIALAILVAGLGLRLWLYRQPVNSDDIQYFDLSATLGQGDFVAEAVFRLTLLTPLWILRQFFGSSVTSFYGGVYTFAIVTGAAVYLFARVFSGRIPALAVLSLWASSAVFLETDTRLLPDNVGVAMALLGLASLAWGLGLRGIHVKAAPRILAPAAAFVGGLLLWASWGARATFAPFIIVGGLLVLWARPGRRLVSWAIGGLLIGFVGELIYVAATFDDVFIRVSDLVAAGAPEISKPVAGNRIFAGNTYGDLPLRYPRLLAALPTYEVALHAVGWLGAVTWLMRWRNASDRVKLMAFAASYGLIAFALTSFDPPIVLMRTKLRYYATAAPFFYLATVDLFVAGGRWVAPMLKQRLDSVGRPSIGANLHRLGIAGFAAVLLVVSTAQASALLDKNDAARNGNDGLLRAWREVERHADVEGSPAGSRVIHTDDRTKRVFDVLFDDAWQVVTHEFESEFENDERTPGYEILDWVRLNANVERTYTGAPHTDVHYRDVENYGVLYRHRRAASLIDVMIVPPEPLNRAVDDVTADLGTWSLATEKGTSTVNPSSTPVGMQQGDTLYSGGGGITSPSASPEVPAGSIVEVAVTGQYIDKLAGSERSRANARVRVQLNWHDPGGGYHRQYMGQAVLTGEEREVGLWTYLPARASDFRVAIEVVDAARVRFSAAEVLILGSSELDEARQTGGAW